MPQSRHITLVASTNTPVTLDGRVSGVTVINRGGTGGPFEIYFTTDGTIPTIGGNDTFVVPAQVGNEQPAGTPPMDPVDRPESTPTTINLISSGAAAVTVLS
jgi:hypothetical protein